MTRPWHEEAAEWLARDGIGTGSDVEMLEGWLRAALFERAEREVATPKTWQPLEPLLQAAAKAEREAIATWLRTGGPKGSTIAGPGCFSSCVRAIADAIEAGEHRHPHAASSE